MESLHHLSIVFAYLPGRKSTGPGEFFFFFLHFTAEIIKFNFNPWWKIGQPPGHLDRVYLSKKVVAITCSLEKKFFSAATLKICQSFPFRQGKKTCGILWSARVFFEFPEKRRPNGTKYSRMDPVKFVEQFLKNLTWSILEYFVPNEYSL